MNSGLRRERAGFYPGMFIMANVQYSAAGVLSPSGVSVTTDAGTFRSPIKTQPSQVAARSTAESPREQQFTRIYCLLWRREEFNHKRYHKLDNLR